MQNFQALGAPPPDPCASGGWGPCPQPRASPPHPQISPSTANSWLRTSIPVDIYLIYLTIIPLKSSAMPQPSTQEPVVSSTNQNINGPSLITSTKHHKTIDFLCLCALAINFLLSRLNLTLYLNSYVQEESFCPSRYWSGFETTLHVVICFSQT